MEDKMAATPNRSMPIAAIHGRMKLAKNLVGNAGYPELLCMAEDFVLNK
jgi:hypothetical protein